MFYFFKEAEDGTYNLMEIYSDRKGNLTAKTFYKTRKDASQRVMDIEKSLLPTSETYFGAILLNTKIPQMFESTSIEEDFSAREGEGAYTDGDAQYRPIFGGNKGYVDYSMSKRAAQARNEGRYPKTDFRKEYQVTPKSFDLLIDAGIIDNSE